jgi:lipid A 3-O-deacylase
VSGRFRTQRLALLVAAFAVQGATAQEGWAPSSVFVQAGSVASVRTLTVGTTWDWQQSWLVGSGRLGGYWEASAAGWSYPSVDGGRTGLAQFAVKPVLRWRPSDGASNWFFEASIGLTLTNRLYESERKRFSTRFNFGDSLSVGRSFGDAHQHELALRVEHFSNGSIREPNPGETMAQLRYAYRFK